MWKTKIEELRLLLGESTEQNAGLQKQIKEATEREHLATAKLAEAQNHATSLHQKAEKEQQKADLSEKVIVSVRNKDGNVLEIISLEELSSEKLTELGFDAVLLKSKQE